MTVGRSFISQVMSYSCVYYLYAVGSRSGQLKWQTCVLFLNLDYEVFNLLQNPMACQTPIEDCVYEHWHPLKHKQCSEHLTNYFNNCLKSPLSPSQNNEIAFQLFNINSSAVCPHFIPSLLHSADVQTFCSEKESLFVTLESFKERTATRPLSLPLYHNSADKTTHPIQDLSLVTTPPKLKAKSITIFSMFFLGRVRDYVEV